MPERAALAQTNEWDDRFDALGVNGPIYAVAYYANNIYVGGSFTKAGAVDANNIARWDGTAWHALGTGITSDATLAVVFDLTVAANGQIAAGGQFNRANNGIVNSIAIWTGASWSRLESGGQIGVNNTVRAVAYHNGALFVGGLFARAGNLTVNGMAKWNGVRWERVREGNGVDGVTGGAIHVMTSSPELLYVGGDFRMSGIKSANRIAAWDDQNTVWSTLQNGLDGAVHAIAANSNGELFVGGEFTTAGGVIANNVAQWVGNNWRSLGDNQENGVNGAVRALVSGVEGPIIGGQFSNAGTAAASRIVAWNGSNWLSFGPGISGTVFDLIDDGRTSIYVGGQFSAAGNSTSQNFAIWHREATTSIQPSLPSFNSSLLYSNYPNPFNPATTITYDLATPSHVVFKVHDLLGREITTLVNETQTAGRKSVVWHGTDSHGQRVSAGIYFYRILTNSFVQSKKMILLP